jgi:peptide/nickel transport system substrate-binding protein
LAVTLLTLLLVGGCDLKAPSLTSVPVSTGGSITEALVGTLGALSPPFENGDNERDIDGLIYQGLTTLGPDQRPAGLLARDWAVSDQGRTYTFHLRPGVRWADGQPFTASDVLFTIHLWQDPASRRVGEDWGKVSAEKLDELTVRFQLPSPSASFPLALASGIVPEHILAGISGDRIVADPHSNARALGTGPFRVASISADRKLVTLQRNVYARPAPRLDMVSFRLYPTPADALAAVTRGEVDTTGALQPPQISIFDQRTDLSVSEAATFDCTALLFNFSGKAAPFFDSNSVRIALAQAVDRDAIVRDLLEGHAQAAPGPIPPGSWAYAPAEAGRHPYDPGAAAAALDQAGWVIDRSSGLRAKDGTTFSITLETLDGYPYRQVATAISGQLARIGVKVTVDTVPEVGLIGNKLLRHEYQMALINLDLGPDPDQISLWHSDQGGGGINFSGPSLPHQALIDKDLEDGRASLDRPARAAAYADFQGLLSDAAPGIFLFSPHYLYIALKRVRGVRIDSVIEPAERFEHAAEWYVLS